MSGRHLEFLLSPRSVSVIGASDRDGSVGATAWRNLRGGGCKGTVYAVNPSHAQLGGEAVWPTVASLPQAPDRDGGAWREGTPRGRRLHLITAKIPLSVSADIDPQICPADRRDRFRKLPGRWGLKRSTGD